MANDDQTGDEARRIGRSTPRDRRSLTRKQLWVAYVMGAYGLSMTAQGNFLVPLRARELGASFETIGLLVAAGAIVPALVSVPLGGLVDRFRARPSFVAGTVASAVVTAAFVFVDNYWLLLPLQVVFGVTRTYAWIASQSYVTAVGRPEDRGAIASRFSFFTNAGAMVGPLMIGFVAQLVGFQLAFLAIAVYCLVFAALGVAAVETSAATKAGEKRTGGGLNLRAVLTLARVPGIQTMLLLSAMRLWTSWVLTGFFPVYLTDNGVAPAAVGTVVTLRAFVSMITAPTTPLLTRRLSDQAACALGVGCGAVGIMIAPLFTSLPAAYIPAILVGISVGVSLPLLLSIIADTVTEEQRGLVLGMRISANQIAGSAAPLVAGPLIAAAGATIGFLVSGGFAGVLVTVAYLIYRADRHKP